ncbi:hypothetical protein BJ322DRAFT_1104647 [Thelephora terrestris]|uniref:RING-type domain-containing protein n=1 Tax=Thelephora terrestris TaxID=56493 RepID=A0A9P6HPL5_9AGAM|nr:hypothetical protein BJ322DRAFT_1104647 [Thelephora terrestris]
MTQVTFSLILSLPPPRLLFIDSPMVKKPTKDLSKGFHELMEARTPQRPTQGSASSPIRPGPRKQRYTQSEREESDQLKRRYKIMQKGFITLEDLCRAQRVENQTLQEELQTNSAAYESTLSKLLDELDKKDEAIKLLSTGAQTRAREAETLSAELEATRKMVQEMETVSTAEGEKSLLGTCAEFLKCEFCSCQLVVPFSLDCRHAGCFTCVLNGFNNNGTFCPKCKAYCGNPPQYDVSLENFLSLVHSRTGRPHLTAGSSSIDPKTFEKLYSQRLATVAASQPAGAQTQAPGMSSSSVDPQDLTQAQVQSSDLTKQAGPASVAAGIRGGDLASTPMDL